MAFDTGNAPYWRLSERAGNRHLTILLLLLPLIIFSGIFYGPRPVILVLIAAVSANLCELIACLLMKRRPTLHDGAATVTGLFVGMLMSPLSPYWLPAIASAFAIWVVKMPFGGLGHEPFLPSAAGVAFATQCFTTALFTYPTDKLTQPLPLDNLTEVVTETSPAALLSAGIAPTYTPTAWLVGQIPGPIGTTSAVLLVACMIGLFLRRATSPLITLPYIATCAIYALLFPRTQAAPLAGMLAELCSGYLLFAGIFMLPAGITAPRHWLGRVVYGVGGGLLVMLLRSAGRFEEGACFAVLLMNAMAPVIDRACWWITYHLAWHREEEAL